MATQARRAKPKRAAPHHVGELSQYTTIASSLATTVQTGIRCGAFVAIAYFAFKALEVMAGQKTEANIVLNVLGDISVSTSLAWGTAALAGGYGYTQSRLRKRTIGRLQGRIKELEAGIDPGRSSSHLTPEGDTNPDDVK